MRTLFVRVDSRRKHPERLSRCLTGRGRKSQSSTERVKHVLSYDHTSYGPNHILWSKSPIRAVRTKTGGWGRSARGIWGYSEQLCVQGGPSPIWTSLDAMRTIVSKAVSPTRNFHASATLRLRVDACDASATIPSNKKKTTLCRKTIIKCRFWRPAPTYNQERTVR